MKTNEIDVTRIAPGKRHSLLLDTFEALPLGASFTIRNDHNPKPLYNEMVAQWGDAVTWEYLEEGPETWKVQIGKLATPTLTIGDIVAGDFRKAEIFKKAGIDFCCGGKISVEQACREKGIDKGKLELELRKVDELPLQPSQDYNHWEPDFLCNYIENTHHKYVYRALPELLEYTRKIASVHGSHHPELMDVAEQFGKINEELLQHLDREEKVLFPAIRDAVNALKNNTPLTQKQLLNDEISRMTEEHEFAGGAMDHIRLITNNYEVPADGCNTYRVTLKLLAQFEDDLHQHVHLENNILYPRALHFGS